MGDRDPGWLARLLMDDWAKAESGRSLAARACDIVTAGLDVDGMSVVVMSEVTRREQVWAGDTVALFLEDLQFTIGQGPCNEAFLLGGPVLVEDLSRADDRWPLFTGAVAEAGVRALFCFPLTIGTIRLGTMELYRLSAGPLHREEITELLIVADTMALQLLGRLILDPEDEEDDPELGGHAGQDDFFDHAEVHQATGVMMGVLGIGPEEALIRLRAMAFTQNRLVTDLAHEIMTGRFRFDDQDD